MSTLTETRIAAHRAFDPIWEFGTMSREDAYTWLAKQLGIPRKNCHMLQMDEAMCAKVIEVCKNR
ncbi:MAG: zinc-finger-containing protein [Aestuariivirga sp.]